MTLFVTANTVMWYIYAKVLQGAATAILTVAGLTILTDAVDKHQLGQMIGYVSTAMILGFMSGSPIGGMIFEFGGYYTVLGIAFGLIALDMLLRLSVVEKKVATRWQTLPEYCPYKGHTYTSGYFSCETIFNRENSHDNSRPSGSLALVTLLQQSRILISLWAVIVSALVMSALDAVSTLNSNLVESVVNLFLDACYLCARRVSFKCTGLRFSIHPGSLCSASTALLW